MTDDNGQTTIHGQSVPTGAKVHRYELVNEHHAVRSDGGLVQFPDADGFSIDDMSNELKVKRQGNTIALFPSRSWDAIYWPNTRRIVVDVFDPE